MSEAELRDKLAMISSRPPAEWEHRLAREFPRDPALRMQALLWLHAEKENDDLEGAAPSLGEAADERYELSVRLDMGSTSSVWQAFDRRLGRNVAIKVFRTSDSDVLDQVLAEARAASDVISDFVVRVLDVQYGDGHPYIVMELVSEYDPEQEQVVLGTPASATKPHTIEEAVRWVMQVARGVQDAHMRNVFHRDLKPKNVLITPISRRARIADFGLAVSGASPDASHPTITLLKRGPAGPVSVRGTPEYMAPEQARGLPLSLDARNANDRDVLVAIDVWGLGAIAYDLLVGRPPWLVRKEENVSAWEVAASTERPPSLVRTGDDERIPRRLRRVIDKAMATDPKNRYASAAAFANELNDFLTQRPTTLDRSRLLRVGLWSRRNPPLTVALVAALGLTGVAVGTHVTVTRLRDERVALDRKISAQKADKQHLAQDVATAHADLEKTQEKLAAERLNLETLEKSIDEERASYTTLIEAKEQALQDATRSTRRILEQLDAAKRDRKSTLEARAAAEKAVAELKRDLEKVQRERDKIRRERDVARTERDAAQREREAVAADYDRVERELRMLKADLEEQPNTAARR